MKTFGTAVFGLLVPGGAYLASRRYVQFGIALSLVLAATVAGVALHGTNLWPGAVDVAGLDGFTAGIAKLGGLARMASGAPYFLVRLGQYSQSYLAGQTHEYGSILMALAGVFNLLALADGLALRKADRA